MTHRICKCKIIIDGREFGSIGSAACAFGLSRNTVDYRLAKGWTPEQAFGLKPRPDYAASTPGITVKVQGHEFASIRQAAKHFGRSYTHIFARLNEGCTLEQALGLIKRTDSLQSEYPELAKQWHPDKNVPLAANSIAPHSGRKVWWLCSHGHEWKAVVGSRTRGMGCPYCAGQKPTADRNFATEYPKLAKEWDWEKNDHARPEDFTPRSSSKVWWRCEKGHSWQATISNRTRGYEGGCPYCSNRKVSAASAVSADNCLAQIRPDIAKDWHPYKNAPLTPTGVVAGGHKKVWWICKHGHEWQAPIRGRVVAGAGCPKCTNQTSRIEIAVYAELRALFNDVAWRDKIAGHECDIFLRGRGIGVEIDGVYWHRRRPAQELAKSAAFEAEGVQLFRLREAGLPLLSVRDVSFTWSDDAFPIVSRLVDSMLKYARLPDDERLKLRTYINGPGLINQMLYRELVANLPAPPPDQSLAYKHPEIAKHWAFDLNAPLLPEHFRFASNKTVWWRCQKSHVWEAPISNRARLGSGCPACAGQVVTAETNLAVLNPALASEWHPTKNGNLHPEDILPKSNQDIWWQCKKGHEWQAQPNNRAKGSGCPYCYGRRATKEKNLASKHPELLEEWDREKNIGLDPSDFTPRSPKKAWWRCASGHSWQASIVSRTKSKSGCPECWRSRPRPPQRKHTLADMKSIAAAKGGRCLSTEYRGVEVKHRWQCAKGHEWDAIPKNLLKHDSWCPVCARTRNALRVTERLRQNQTTTAKENTR